MFTSQYREDDFTEDFEHVCSWQGKRVLLAELGQLNLKVDRLHIKHLERVKSVEDAKEANMLSKHVKNLWLSWERTEESQLQENVEQILEVLQPYTQQLKELDVKGYTGSYFPEWMSSPSLIHLQTLGLVNCKSCLHIPQLEKLPSLKVLTILACSELEIDDLGKLPSLERLTIQGCSKLEIIELGKLPSLGVLKLDELPNLSRLSREDGENMFPLLSRLEIRSCPNLLGLPCLPSLKDMDIVSKCKHDLLSSIHKLGSIESLKLRNIEELTCFPDGMLTNLTFLKKLIIDNCSVIEGLGEDLQHVTDLESLSLEHLPNLTSLPDSLGNLSSLQDLYIYNCPKLNCLPASIQSLSALKNLFIFDCLELEKRCKRETGEDWPKISHIQTLKGDCFR